MRVRYSKVLLVVEAEMSFGVYLCVHLQLKPTPFSVELVSTQPTGLSTRQS